MVDIPCGQLGLFVPRVVVMEQRADPEHALNLYQETVGRLAASWESPVRMQAAASKNAL